MGLPFHLLSPSVLAQEVCIAEGLGTPAGTKEKEVFSFGISTWFLQKLLRNTRITIFCPWPCLESFPFKESQDGRHLKVCLETTYPIPSSNLSNLLIWRGFVCFQGCMAHSPFGEPIPVLDHPHWLKLGSIFKWNFWYFSAATNTPLGELDQEFLPSHICSKKDCPPFCAVSGMLHLFPSQPSTLMSPKEKEMAVSPPGFQWI